MLDFVNGLMDLKNAFLSKEVYRAHPENLDKRISHLATTGVLICDVVAVVPAVLGNNDVFKRIRAIQIGLTIIDLIGKVKTDSKFYPNPLKKLDSLIYCVALPIMTAIYFSSSISEKNIDATIGATVSRIALEVYLVKLRYQMERS